MNLQQATPRSYLQHRLPEGELLSEIQAVSAMDNIAYTYIVTMHDRLWPRPTL